jgi:GNAT superfamily N-acetyltransferase
VSIELGDLRDDDVDEVIAVINAAFGFERDGDWFAWKHREGPWGASTGAVARDERGIVGVRLLLPWRFRGPAGTLTAHRAVEAATAPRAQGKGVFSLLNRHLMDRTAASGASAIFSTPNAASRGGYAKLGWSWLTPVPHVWRPVRPRRRPRALLEGSDAIATFPTGVHLGSIATDWSIAALTWRLDPRSGHSYEVIADPGGGGGIAFRRVVTSRMPALLPLVGWGEPRERRRLLGHAAFRSRAVALLDTGPPGGAPLSTARGVRRGGSLLAVWPTPTLSRTAWPLDDVRRWHVGFADLENVL